MGWCFGTENDTNVLHISMKLLRASFLNRLSPRFALDPPPKISEWWHFTISLEVGEAVWINRFMNSMNSRSGISHLPPEKNRWIQYKHVGNGRKLEQHVHLHIKTYTRRIYFLNPKNYKKLTLELNMGEIWPPNQLRGHLPVVYSPEDLVTVQIGDDIVIIPEPEFGGSKLGCPVPVYFWDWS